MRLIAFGRKEGIVALLLMVRRLLAVGQRHLLASTTRRCGTNFESIRVVGCKMKCLVIQIFKLLNKRVH